MRIRNNFSALVAWRSFSTNSNQSSKSIESLSSGYRINSAADDVAGLGIVERFRGQVKGLMQAKQNALDGLSLLNTAESGLHEIHSLLQRGRELSVQAANGTLTDDEKRSIQTEMDHVLAEVDRISDSTTFNGKRLLSTSGKAALTARVINGLQTGWLEQAAKLIFDNYGLAGSPTDPIRITLNPSGNTDTWIVGLPGVNGELVDVQLNINLDAFDGPLSADGGNGPVFNDRKIARALTHAVLAQRTSYINLDRWFVSGSADFLAGADELLTRTYRSQGAAAIASAIDTWGTDDLHRASAYLAVKYLHAQLTGLGVATQDFFGYLAAGNDLDSALFLYTGTGTSAFVADFKANAAAYLTWLDTNGQLDDNNTDVGAIGGGGPSTVVPNGGSFPVPGYNFKIDVPTSDNATELKLQVGANQGDIISVRLPEVTTFSLGLFGVDVRTQAARAIEQMDKAIQSVSGARSSLGSASNRLEYATHANAYAQEQQQGGLSRIKDLDYAQQTARLAKQQIMVATSGAMLAQANTMKQNVMWLLRGMETRLG